MYSRVLMPALITLLWLSGILPGHLQAQTSVTPNLMPKPSGQLITVNNGPGDQTEPHVSGNLISYSDQDNLVFTVRYYDFDTASDTAVPNSDPSNLRDFISDVTDNTAPMHSI